MSLILEGFKLKKCFFLLILLLATACTVSVDQPTKIKPTSNFIITETPPPTKNPREEPTEIPTIPPTVKPSIEVATVITTAVVTEQPLPPPPVMPDADEVVFATDGYMAFVQEGALYIQDLAQANPAVFVEKCVNPTPCLNTHFKWSPDGQFLLYYHTENYDFGEIRLATRQGKWQTVGTKAHHQHPADWSPDGKEIVYLRDTGDIQSTEIDVIVEGDELTIDMDLPLMEVYTIPLEDGVPETPQLNGTLTLSQPGCGGTYSSESAFLYGYEGGATLGYGMGVLAWTDQDILLFTLHCNNTGIGRYDLRSGTEVESLDRAVRNLILSPDKSRWYGVSGTFWPMEEYETELVTGVPTETAVTTIPTNNPVEMIFMGQQSDHVYVTSRTKLDIGEKTEAWVAFYETVLLQMDMDAGTETAVYQGEDYAIVHVQEAADGTVMFVQIENDIPRYNADKAGVSGELLEEYNPRRHIVALDQIGNLLYLHPDAGSLSVTP